MPIINSSFTTKIRNPGKQNLLEYLAQRFTYHNQEKWLELIKLGRLELTGTCANGAESLKEGQTLKFVVVDYHEPTVPVNFKIITEGDRVKLIHKPAGLPVHRTGKIFFQTFANLIREYLGDTTWSPLNRLDVETSGLMAFAKGPEAFKEFAPASSSTNWTKLYLAVVKGIVPDSLREINLSLSEINSSPIRCKMHVVAQGKHSVSLVRVIAVSRGFSLLVVAPLTGRKHQIRAHLSASGFPIVGDKIYSQDGLAYLKQLNEELNADDFQVLGARYHLLHAFYLQLENQDENKQTQEIITGWDFEFGEGFSPYFDPEIIRSWCFNQDEKTSEFQQLLLETKKIKLRAAPASF